jgi:hypothetical protein
VLLKTRRLSLSAKGHGFIIISSFFSPHTHQIMHLTKHKSTRPRKQRMDTLAGEGELGGDGEKVGE